MDNPTMDERIYSRWDSRLFLIAGSFMLLNTVLLWVRLYSNYQLSILWAAIPAIIALASAVLGLLKLYPRTSAASPRMAKIGAVFALLATASLSVAAFWILVAAIVGGGFPEPAPPAFLLLVAAFMIAMVLAFITNTFVFLWRSSHRKIGYLLSVPVTMWALMLLVGMIKGMEVGLSLDFYTNAVIGTAFLVLGFFLDRSRNTA